jgi:hypothetical protein
MARASPGRRMVQDSPLQLRITFREASHMRFGGNQVSEWVLPLWPPNR